MSIDDEIRNAVAEETNRSRYRDRRSDEQVHPIQHDIDALVDFVIARRRSVPGAVESARDAYDRVDPTALRELVDIVRGGSCDLTTARVCDRVEEYTTTLEAAHRLRDSLRDPDIH
jgi:hypothetical protein